MTGARAAIIKSGAHTRKEVDAYLPNNYATVVRETYPGEDFGTGVVLDENTGHQVALAVVGIDVAGWTLEDYVIPRLASGMIWAEPIGQVVA